MEFTFTFVEVFAITLYLVGPLLLFLFTVIAMLGYAVGRMEDWSLLDSIYYAFITATTVGYGDFRPQKRLSKCTAILIALVGLVCTGIIVAAGLKAVEAAFAVNYDVEQLIRNIKMRLAG